MSYGKRVPTRELLFPSRDKHFKKFDHYQFEIYEAALNYVRARDLAVDIGAHAGIHTLYMEHDFLKVHSFEPVQENYMCLQYNIQYRARDPERVYTHNCGLSDKSDTVRIKCMKSDNSGAWEIQADKEDKMSQNCLLMPMDIFNLRPNLIKIDVQGHEYKALKGAERTLRDCRPTLIVEFWGEGDTTPIQQYLEELGYRLAQRINKDVIMVCDA